MMYLTLEALHVVAVVAVVAVMAIVLRAFATCARGASMPVVWAADIGSRSSDTGSASGG